jgi:predicted AAA+ superfamily ATPase
MSENPYKYLGPLDPVKDSLVYIPRKEDATRVIEGINKGEYWTILGSRQIGKTTFLRHIKNAFSNAYTIYFNFETPPSNDQKLYQWLIDQFHKEIPSEQPEVYKNEGKGYDPAPRFVNFLEHFKPKEGKKVILFFDEIDGLPSLISFLHTWRLVFIKRYDIPELNQYAVIITGSTDLIKINIGSNSPFNISQTLHLKDFSNKESEKLIDEPFKTYNIQIKQNAKENLLSQISGHPQMLQHACCILFEKVKNSKYDKPIDEKDVDETIELLLVENSTIKTLRQDVKHNEELNELVQDILKGKEIRFHPYEEYSILGAGSIINENSYCKIRNRIFEKALHDLLNQNAPKKRKILFTTTASVLAAITSFFATLAKSSTLMIVAIIFLLFTVLFFILKR